MNVTLKLKLSNEEEFIEKKYHLSKLSDSSDLNQKAKALHDLSIFALNAVHSAYIAASDIAAVYFKS